MKRIFKRLQEKLKFKEVSPPPPYRENDISPLRNELNGSDGSDISSPFEVLDLLANCNIAPIRSSSASDVSYAEIQDMGIWHSTPLSKRHKSKVSLTWVLKENLDNTKNVKNQAEKTHERRNTLHNAEKQRRFEFDHRHQQRSVGGSDFRTSRPTDRVVGRKEQYELKYKSVCEVEQSCSDSSVSEELRRRHRHRHRKKKKRRSGRYGYDITDLDCFLSEASIDKPGNIPVVVAYPTTLYQTQSGVQREHPLPLGTVVNAVFKSRQWIYVQTPHQVEGYVLHSACLPLGILPNRTSTQKKTPCWESSTDIYPRPCGNLTDTEKEQLRGRTRSECRYRPSASEKRRTKPNAEEHFDTLYLRSKSMSSNMDKVYDDCDKKSERSRKSYKKCEMRRQTLLVVNNDYRGSPMNRTLSVKQGDVVAMIRRNTDVNSDWFFVRKKDGAQGFIPAVVAGNGYI